MLLTPSYQGLKQNVTYRGTIASMVTSAKKFLFVVTKSGLGGASRSVRELAEALSGTMSVAVAAGGNGELFEVLKKKGVRTISIPTLARDISLIKEIKTFLYFVQLFKTERPDVVHLHSPKAGGLGALAARMVGIKKIIYTAHGWAFFEDRPFYQKMIIRLFSYLIVLLSHSIVAVSKKDSRAFDGWPFVKNKIVYIPNSVALPSSALTRAEARKQLDISSDTFVVGTIAELHKNKGLSYLIEAAEKVPDAMFVVIGEGEERKRLGLAIVAHRLANRFLLKGYIPDAHTLIRAFDVFVLSSVKEGLPYVLLEAGAAEVPVVATNIGGIPDLIEHEKTGLLVSPKDPSALAQALTRLQSDAPLRPSLASSLKQKIEREFSFDLMIQNTVTVYKI